MDQTHAQPAARAALRLPLVTIAIAGATAIVTLLQFRYPIVLETLRRNPAALAQGQWWRMLSPLLVHSDGWTQFIINLCSLALIGAAVERLYGRWRWLLLYLLGGLAGNIAGYAWLPTGAGASVGVCGLLGALLVWMLWHNSIADGVAAIFAMYLLPALLGFAIGDFIWALVGCVVIGNALALLLRRSRPPQPWPRICAGAGLLLAIVLLLLRDNHGPALLAGSCAAALLIWPMEKRIALL